MKTPEQKLLDERKKRGAKPAPKGSFEANHRATVLVQQEPDPMKRHCTRCFAAPGEPCISMGSGKKLSKCHTAREDTYVAVPAFEAGSNKMTEEGLRLQMDMAPSLFRNTNPKKREWNDYVRAMTRIQFDPGDERTLPESGAFVTFVGSPHGVSGAFKKLRPGHTYFAKWAPETVEGYDKHGQYKIHFTTEHGPVWLLAYEYVILQPLHLWHFVKEGHLKFTAKGIAENDLEWQTFYLMSKGVPRNEALVMTLGSINKDVGWFEPTEDKGSQWWRFQATGLTPMQKEELLVGLPPGSIG